MHSMRNAVTAMLVSGLAIVIGGGLPACSSSSFGLFDTPDGGPGGLDGAAGGDGGLVGWCPPYRTYCNGACIPTQADPNNCGGCGVACTGDLACSGGACRNACLPGLKNCGNACVDPDSDSQHCGGCGIACGPGKGCVAGKCENTVVVGPTPAKCGGGGPPIINPPSQGGCLGNTAQTVFRWAICSCKSVQFSEPYMTDGYNSRTGPYAPGGLGAGIGANENHGASKTGEIWGSLWIAGSSGIAPSSQHVVKSELHTGGALKPGGAFSVGKNVYAEDEVSGPLSIGGKIYVPKRDNAKDFSDPQVVVAPVDVKAPCDFCEGNQKVPMAAIIDAHRPPNNDNALIGLAANAYDSPDGPLRLDLPCGEYYLTRIASSSHVTIVAHGRTALYIDGEVSPNGLTLGVAPGGEFDVVIREKIQTSGKLDIGSPNYPAAIRVYIDGTSGMTISGEVSIAGNVYVPNGPVTYSSEAEQFGSIYAGDFSTSKPLKLHYDRAIVNAGDTCAPPPPTGGDGGTDSGTPPPPSCGSCRDCGNQACTNGKCGACGTSEDCCAPLVCREGRCIADVH